MLDFLNTGRKIYLLENLFAEDDGRRDCKEYVAAGNNANNLPDKIIEGHTYHYLYSNGDSLNHRVGPVLAGPCPKKLAILLL